METDLLRLILCLLLILKILHTDTENEMEIPVKQDPQPFITPFSIVKFEEFLIRPLYGV